MGIGVSLLPGAYRWCVVEVFAEIVAMAGGRFSLVLIENLFSAAGAEEEVGRYGGHMNVHNPVQLVGSIL